MQTALLLALLPALLSASPAAALLHGFSWVPLDGSGKCSSTCQSAGLSVVDGGSSGYSLCWWVERRACREGMPALAGPGQQDCCWSCVPAACDS